MAAQVLGRYDGRVRRLPFILTVLLTSCSTFGDLERDHPYDGGCDDGFVKNEVGECVRSFSNDVSNEPNNTSNEPNNASNQPNNVSNVPTPCEVEPGTCCDTPDGAYCCTDDGCCSFDPAECEEPPNNNPPNSNPLLGEYMLVIADANQQECEDQGWDGPDIFGVRVEVDNAELFPYIAGFSEGSNAVFSEDAASEVIQGVDPNFPECPNSLSFSLGCGGWVGIGFQGDDNVDVTAAGRLTILESGPQCDQAGDLYMVLVCPMGDPEIQGNDCWPIIDSAQGHFDEEVQLF